MPLLTLMANLAAVALVLVGELAAIRWLVSGRAPWPLSRVQDKLEEIRERYREPPEPMPTVLLGLELRRLGELARRVDEGDQPAKAARLEACRWAYDHVLLEYCRTVDVPLPREGLPLTERQRLEAETALIAAGQEW